MENKIEENRLRTDGSLLLRFNNREELAYSEVYVKFYDELSHFALKLYKDTEIESADLLQDIFISIWENKKMKFDTIFHIKAYAYMSIKNRYRDYLSHRKHVDNYANLLKLEDENQVSYIVESEALSLLSKAIELLPEECAKVFKLHIEGWNTKEIADILGKTQSTVYTQRSDAINFLKKKLPPSLYCLLT